MCRSPPVLRVLGVYRNADQTEFAMCILMELQQEIVKSSSFCFPYILSVITVDPVAYQPCRSYHTSFLFYCRDH